MWAWIAKPHTTALKPYAADANLDTFLRQAKGVIHVGANSGQERDCYRGLGLPVIWVEAMAEVFDQLVSNIADYPNQRAFCALLTDRDNVEYDFHIASNHGASSSILPLALHRDIWPNVTYVATRRLRSTTLATLFQRENLSPVQYPTLIMDVQGAELMVLKGAGSLIQNFRFVKAEAADFESYAGGARLNQLQVYLREFGFRELARRPFARRAEGGTYWDVVWQR